VFCNLCKRFNIIKDISLRRQARIRSNTYNRDVFIRKAIEVHGNKYCYDKVDYVKSSIPVLIGCPEHGEFSQKPVSHLQGFGCQVCGGSKKFSLDDFIRRSREVHGDRYYYDLVDYRNMVSPVRILCSTHGEFLQKPVKHIGGQGCPKCSSNAKLDVDVFISRARKKHGEKFDYSKVVFKGMDEKVVIVCPIHGDFLQSPNNHLRYGCPKCGVKSSGNSNYQDCFIRRAREVHGDRYNYDLVQYFNAFTYVKIVCSEHGVFEQAPFDHLQGKGCGKCAGNVKLGTIEFINRSRKIHGDRYDYSLSDYISSHDKVRIVCKVHGEFEQSAISHYNGYGCPNCASLVSKAHKEIGDFIGLSDLVYNDRDKINPFEIDLFIPSKNLGIEYNDIWWHSFNKLETTEERNKHKYKQDLCEKNGIRLIQIFENEWIFKQNIVKSMLNVLLNRVNRVYARDCMVSVVDHITFNNFCNENHLQGQLFSKVKYGLFYEGKLLMVIGFNGKDGVFECTRLCSLLNTVVVGGFGKLLSRFIRDCNPKVIDSFANRRFFNGSAYRQLGFKLLYATGPNYFYYRGGKVYNRLGFQKHKLKGKLELFDEGLSEAENLFLNGFRRFWDAGHLKFRWEI